MARKALATHNGHNVTASKYFNTIMKSLFIIDDKPQVINKYNRL